MPDNASTTPRRGFLGHLAAAAVGAAATSAMPAVLTAESLSGARTNPQLEAWFGKLTGKHRIVFDAPAPNSGMPGVWPRVYLNTMQATYPSEDASVMVILRHEGLPLAFGDAIWAKYKFGETFNIKNGDAPAVTNPYANITTLPLPGLGIAALLKSGVLVGACDVMLTLASGAAAKQMNRDPAAVKQEWIAGLLPGVQVVPSGVMAVGRAQEAGAKYCFAG